MKLKGLILSLTTLFSFISLLPATGAADEPAEPNPLLLDKELAQIVKQAVENPDGVFFRDNPHIIVTPLTSPWNHADERVGNVDILFILDTSSMMRIDRPKNSRPTVSAEEKIDWEEFTKQVANTDFSKVSARIRFSLNEDGQLMCWHSMVHGNLDCEDMIHRMFSWIKRAEKQDTLTVSSTEEQIQDYVLGQLMQLDAARTMSAELAHFMKEHDFPDFAMTITSHPFTETQDQ